MTGILTFGITVSSKTLGGRIYSDPDFGIDLGPAWIWPGAHPRIHRLCKTLKVPVFKQPGASPFESQNRIEGGVGRVVDLVAKGVKANDGDIRLEHAVNAVEETADGVTVSATSKGSPVKISAKAVVRCFMLFSKKSCRVGVLFIEKRREWKPN